MSLSIFNVAAAIEVLFDGQNQPWFKRAHVGKFLALSQIEKSLSGLERESKPRSAFEPTCSSTMGWSGPKSEQNKTDVFLSVYGVIYAVVKSRKSKGRELREWILKDIVPRGFNELVKEHQKAIEKKQRSIDEKDMQIALLDDDLTDAQQNIVILEHDNLELQAEVERLTTRTVPYLENPEKDNGMAIIQKNDGDSYPYLAVCGQRGYVAQKIQNELVNYPNSQIVVLAETPNAIVHFNWLRERGCIVANPVRVRHFRLNENYTHQRLVELREA